MEERTSLLWQICKGILVFLVCLFSLLFIIIAGDTRLHCGRFDKTKVLMDTIAQALSAYGADYFQIFPSGRDDFTSQESHGFSGNQNLVKSLCTPSNKGGGKNGPYLHLKGFEESLLGQGIPDGADVVEVNGKIELRDWWKNSIRYKSKWYLDSRGNLQEDKEMQQDYMMMSMGPDRKTGGKYSKDDIYR